MYQYYTIVVLIGGVVSFSIDPRSLATGDFYARIHIDAPAATNSPVDFLIVSDVAPANALAIPNPSPAGLLFISSPGSLVPAGTTARAWVGAIRRLFREPVQVSLAIFM